MSDKQELYVVISARHDTSPQGIHLFEESRVTAIEPRFPGILYVGKVINEVFSSAWEIELADGRDCQLEIPEISIKESLHLKRAAFLVSDESRLGKTESNDHFLVLVFGHDDVENFPDMKSRGVADRVVVGAFLDAIQSIAPFSDHPELLDLFRINFPGLLSGKLDASSDENAKHVTPFLFAFYYYAHLICWRLEREQIGLRLELMDTPDSAVINNVMAQRLRVINLKRYFLTNNRSSHPEIKAFCKSRVEAHNLETKYERYKDVLELFESYLSSVNDISQERGGRAVRKTLNVLAFIAIPLGLYGAISDLTPNKDFFVQPEKILATPDIWFWLAVSFIVPIALITIGHLWDKRAHKHSAR